MALLESAIERQSRLPRFLCHLFQRLQQGNLNLVTGAGISIDAGVPSWPDLLKRLAEHSTELNADLEVHRKSGLTPEYLGQIIYHRHREFDRSREISLEKEASVNHGWAEAIHNSLYRNVDNNIEQVLARHPYLSSLQKLAKKLPFVINFNFDDILYQAMSHRKENDNDKSSFSVEWRPPLVERKGNTTIYHVNGLLPQVALRKRSPKLIFTEDSFADALARAPGISSEYLFMRFVQNTMLIVGHSLSDTSLKNYLRQNREKNPANHHYMIYWLKEENTLSAEQRDDVFNANLELYNVVTIFLVSEEICQFFDFLNFDERAFRDAMDEIKPDLRSRYHYYIVGPVAAGKSSLLENLRCFGTFEEWTQPPPAELYVAFDKLTPEQSAKVNNFIYRELKEKNYRFNKCEIGFHFMDRAPLDLYAFSETSEENSKKTAELKKHVTRHRALQSGEIIFLCAKGSELVKRNYSRGRPPEAAGTEDYFDKQIETLKGIYKPTMIFYTDSETSQGIAKKVVRHVLFGDYTPVDLGEIMRRYE